MSNTPYPAYPPTALDSGQPPINYELAVTLKDEDVLHLVKTRFPELQDLILLTSQLMSLSLIIDARDLEIWENKIDMHIDMITMITADAETDKLVFLETMRLFLYMKLRSAYKGHTMQGLTTKRIDFQTNQDQFQNKEKKKGWFQW
jgi:hypothetical protein